MKLKIDTENKTIEIEDQYSIKEIISELKKLFPKDWQEYKLINSKVIEYISYYPIYPQYQELNPYCPLPLNPTIICDGRTISDGGLFIDNGLGYEVINN